MTSRQDDMTNSIIESRPIETFASKFKFFCQSNLSYYLSMEIGETSLLF